MFGGFIMYSYMLSTCSYFNVLVQDTHEQWQTYLLISAGMMLVTSLAFVLKCSGELQSWAELDDDDVVNKCAVGDDDVTSDASSDSSCSYMTSASHSSRDSMTLAKQRALLAPLDDVFIMTRDPASDIAVKKYGTLPCSFRAHQPDMRPLYYADVSITDTAVTSAKPYRNQNFKRYGTLPIGWNTSAARAADSLRKHSDTDVIAASNRRLLQQAPAALSTPARDRLVVRGGGGASGASGGGRDIDRRSPSIERPSTSSHSSGGRASLQRPRDKRS